MRNLILIIFTGLFLISCETTSSESNCITDSSGYRKCYSKTGSMPLKYDKPDQINIYERTVAHLDDWKTLYTGKGSNAIEASKIAFDKCYVNHIDNKKGCLTYSTKVTYDAEGDRGTVDSNFKINEDYAWPRSIKYYEKKYNVKVIDPVEIEFKKKEKEKNLKKEKENLKIAEEKRKAEEENIRKAEEKRKIAEEKKLKEEEEKNYSKLVKDFGPECESSASNLFSGHEPGTEEYDACLLEKLNEKIRIANLEKEKLKKEEEYFKSLSSEEQKAYTCDKTFGFKKGSDNFKECVFKLYTNELELQKAQLEKEKLEIQQLFAAQQEKLLKQEKQITQQETKIKQINKAASETVLLIEQKKLEAAQAQTKAAQQQAAAALQMAQTQMKSYNRQKANALYNQFLNLSNQNNSRSSSTGLGITNCRVYGSGVNKRVQCY